MLSMLGRRLRAQILESVTDRVITAVNVPGGQLRFFTPTPLLISRAEALLTKEPDTIQWIDSFKDDDVMWDIGANIGVFGLYAAIRKKALSVTCFEPLASNYYILTRNIQLNGLANRVAAYCVALSGHTQLGVLNISSTSMGSALSQFGQPGETSRYWEASVAPTIHGMLGFTIDDFVAHFNPPLPTHIKVDVDGLELAILQGARATLRRPELRSLHVELSLSDNQERACALELLEEAGFGLVLQGAVQGAAQHRAANHFFARVR